MNLKKCLKHIQSIKEGCLSDVDVITLYEIDKEIHFIYSLLKKARLVL